jgi:ADP-ribose pyrophosphatase
MTEIYRGRRLSVEKRVFTLPDGREREKVMIHPGDAVAILPVREGRCCLVRQHRFAIGETIWEAPAGTIETGETPLETAKRELAEEVGLGADRWEPLGFIFTTPGFSDERLYLFVARDTYPVTGHLPDDDEILQPFWITIPILMTMCRDGRIRDAKTICLAFRLSTNGLKDDIQEY